MSKQPFHNRKDLKARRRALRNTGTPAEATLWKRLQRRQVQGRRFKRQHSLGPFIVDFYCPAERLAIELDGDGHNDPVRRSYDDERTRFLQTRGIRVIRFENRLVFEQPDAVIAAIAACFEQARE